MGLSDIEYIEVMVSSEIHEHLTENILTPHQPLLFKSLRCFQLIITVNKNLESLFKNIEFLYNKLDTLISSFKNAEVGMEYSIEIKNLILKILFTLLKNYQPKDTAKAEFLVIKYRKFVEDAAKEIIKLFKNPEPEEDSTLILGQDHQDYSVRLSNKEKGYCKTLFSFLIQYCIDDDKVNGK